MYHSSMGSLGYCCIGAHHRSGVETEDCTLRSDRRGALSYRNAHRYVPVFLKRIKLSKGPAWRQGDWAAMSQIDGGSQAKTKNRRMTLGAAGIRKAPRVSNFPIMMARRLAGPRRPRIAERPAEEGTGLSRWAKSRSQSSDPDCGPLYDVFLIPLLHVSSAGRFQEGWEGQVVVGPRGQPGALCAGSRLLHTTSSGSCIGGRRDGFSGISRCTRDRGGCQSLCGSSPLSRIVPGP